MIQANLTMIVVCELRNYHTPNLPWKYTIVHSSKTKKL